MRPGSDHRLACLIGGLFLFGVNAYSPKIGRFVDEVMGHLGITPQNNRFVLSGRGVRFAAVSSLKNRVLIAGRSLILIVGVFAVLSPMTHANVGSQEPLRQSAEPGHHLISTKPLPHHQHHRVISDSSQKHANNINYLVYGSAGEPLQIIEQDGLLSGFVTDVVNEVFAGKDWHIQPVMKPIKRIKREMVQGKAKRWIAYALRSWKSEGVWGNTTFADVDLLSYHLSLGYKKSPISKSLSDISERGVVWIQGFRYPGALEFSRRYDFRFQRAKDHTSMLKMVEAGRVYAFMEYAPRMVYVMNKLEVDRSGYEFLSLADEIPPTSITLLMSNDLGSDVISFINHRLKAMEESGRIHELALRYGLVS